MNMKKFIEPKSDQLNADDLIGGNRIIKITRVKVTETGQQDCVIWFEGDNGKPWKPSKGMGRVLVHAWGEDPKNFVGKWVEIYRDPEPLYAGKKVGGIRIRALSDIEADFEFTETISKSVRKPIKILKLKPPAQQAPAAEVAPEMLKAGADAAKQGAEIYVRWRDSLQPEVRETIRPYNTEWSKTAKAVDAAKQTGGDNGQG